MDGLGVVHHAPARGVRRSDPVEVAISATLLVIFAVAFLIAEQWSFRAALTPLLTTGAGVALSGLHLARSLAGRTGRTRAEQSDGAPPSGDEASWVFATAGRRSWTAALLWVGGFVLSTFVVGLAATGACFAFAYLRVQARASWLVSAAYGVVVGLVVWLVFGLLFEIALPEGLLG